MTGMNSGLEFCNLTSWDDVFLVDQRYFILLAFKQNQFSNPYPGEAINRFNNNRAYFFFEFVCAGKPMEGIFN